MTTDTHENVVHEPPSVIDPPIRDVTPQGPTLHGGRWWLLSILIALILGTTLILLWVARNRETDVRQQLTNETELSEFLDNAWAERGAVGAEEIPTGVFLQSMSFVSASDVHVSAYVWQKFDADQRASVEEGFIVPEFVDSQVAPREEYRVVQDDGTEVIGWYIEGVVRQPFSYDAYPFDHKVVWLRLWPKNFNGNVVLVPDFRAYPCVDDPGSLCTNTEDRFGVDESIVLGEWTTEDTYFDYNIASYNTNFGIDDYVGQRDFPELRFNLEIKRSFRSAFIVHLVPLFVVAALGFGTLLTITHHDEKASVFGFNIAGSLATLSALFFVVLLAHIQLRTQFAAQGVVYLEYFYFVMYLALLGVAVITYLASASWSRDSWVLSTGDMIIPKLLYWPLILLAMVLITLLVL